MQDISDNETELRLSASKKQISESPALDTVLPISSEAELLLAKYWGWIPRYAEGPLPYEARDTIQAETTPETRDLGERASESKLRSFKEVKGYRIHALDGEFGHLEDLLCDDDWRIAYAVVDTRNWLPGKHVLLPVKEVEQIRWAEHELHVGVSCELVKSAPFYDPDTGISPEDEDAVRGHFRQ